MTTRITQDQVMKHMISFAGEKITCSELAKWFGVGERAMASLLKQLVMTNRIASDYVLDGRKKETAYLYADKEKQIAAVAASVRPQRKVTLAEQIMRDRIKELYPEPRTHHEYEHSSIDKNNLDRD